MWETAADIRVSREIGSGLALGLVKAVRGNRVSVGLKAPDTVVLATIGRDGNA